jgi:hypothetical protein
MQNLANAHLTIWAPDISKVVVPNKSPEFFQAFSDFITVRQFDYDDAIKGTPFEGDPFFGSGTLVKTHMPAAGSYSDIVRILILNKHGGKPCKGLASFAQRADACQAATEWLHHLAMRRAVGNTANYAQLR